MISEFQILEDIFSRESITESAERIFSELGFSLFQLDVSSCGITKHLSNYYKYLSVSLALAFCVEPLFSAIGRE